MFTRENEETPFELEVLCFQTKPLATKPDGWVSWGIRYCTGVNQWPGSWSSWGKSLPWLFQVDWELEEIWACSCWLKDLKRSDSWDQYWPKVIWHLLTGEWVKAFRDLEISFTTYLAALLHSISLYIVVHVLLQTNFFPTVALWSFDPPLKTQQKRNLEDPARRSAEGHRIVLGLLRLCGIWDHHGPWEARISQLSEGFRGHGVSWRFTETKRNGLFL